MEKSKVTGNSFDSLKQTKNIAFLGLMGALSIILSSVASFSIGPYIKIGIAGLANQIVSYMLGPMIGAIFGGMMDIIKFILKPTGPYFFGFTLSAIIKGVIYGIFLYKKRLTIKRIFICELIVMLLVDSVLNTLWLQMLYGKAFAIIFPARLLKNIIMCPVNVAILYATTKSIHQIAIKAGFEEIE